MYLQSSELLKEFINSVMSIYLTARVPYKNLIINWFIFIYLKIVNSQNTQMLLQYSLVATERYQRPTSFLRSSNQSIFTIPGFQKSDSDAIYHPDQSELILKERVQQEMFNVETPSIHHEKQINFCFSEIDSYSQYKLEFQCNQPDDLASTFLQDSDSACKTNNQKIQKNLSENQLIISQKKIKKQIGKKNAETKNLPSFFLRLFYRVVYSAQLNPEERRLFINFENSDSLCKASIKKLKEFIQVPCFNKLIIKYIESYQYLNDVLSSDKIINVAIPIKYLRQIHKACYNPDSFNSWTD